MSDKLNPKLPSVVRFRSLIRKSDLLKKQLAGNLMPEGCYGIGKPQPSEAPCSLCPGLMSCKFIGQIQEIDSGRDTAEPVPAAG